MPKSPNVCPFCGRKGDASKEHILGKWTLGYGPPQASTHFTRRAVHEPELGRNEIVIEKTRQGDLRTRQTRTICRICNNGWMGSLQERAKPILAPLIENNLRHEINSSTYLTMANWFLMTLCVLDNSEPPSRAIDQCVYTQLFESKGYGEPLYFAAWFGRHNMDDFKLRRRFVKRALSFSPNGPLSDHPNIISVTLGIGHLLLKGIAGTGVSEYADIRRTCADFAAVNGIPYIFPLYIGSTLAWQAIPEITSAKIEFVMHGFC